VKKRWDLRLSHNQTIDPTLSFRGSANFVSDKTYMKDTSLNPIDRMNRTMRSNFFLNKRWLKSGNSLSASISHSKFLDPPEGSTLDLPQMKFRKSRTPVFKSKKGNLEKPDSEWYHPLLYFFSGDIRNTIRKTQVGDSDVVRTTKNLGIRGGLDLPGSHKALQRVSLSFNGNLEDVGEETKAENTDISKTSRSRSGLGLSSSHKTLGWLNLSPSLGWDERRKWAEDEDEQYVRTDVLNARVGLKTSLYGLFAPRIGTLKGIRHVVEPRATILYKRTFKQNGDKNDPKPSVDLSLNNILQIKTQKGKKERKFTLATLNLSTSCDFEEKTPKLSDLRTSLRIKPVRRFDVRFSARHSLYDRDDTFDPLRPDLKKMSVTTSLRFSGGGSGKKSETSGLRSSTDPFLHRDSDSEERSMIPGLEPPESDERTPASGPWQFQLSHYYGLYKMATSSRKTSWIKGSLRFNPTTHWRVSYAFNYDLEDKKMTAHDVSIHRDLHCWEARFQWTPSGYREGYYFLMNIKELPDIKIEKKRGRGEFSFR
jgi:hypothetical protein